MLPPRIPKPHLKKSHQTLLSLKKTVVIIPTGRQTNPNNNERFIYLSNIIFLALRDSNSRLPPCKRGTLTYFTEEKCPLF